MLTQTTHWFSCQISTQSLAACTECNGPLWERQLGPVLLERDDFHGFNESDLDLNPTTIAGGHPGIRLHCKEDEREAEREIEQGRGAKLGHTLIILFLAVQVVIVVSIHIAHHTEGLVDASHSLAELH